MDPSTLVAAGPSNIPPPLVKPTNQDRRATNAHSHPKPPKRKRIASEASTSVAGEPAGAEGEPPVQVVKERWNAPWLDGLGTTSYDSKEQRLHDEIVAFFQYISPTPDEKHARAMVIAQITEVVGRRFDRSTVNTFGSVAQNLYLPDGDTDLVIKTSRTLNDDTKRRALFQLAALMRSTFITPHVQVIHRARVPVISFQTQPDLGSLKIDISFNADDGVKAVPILREYFDKMPALRFLVLCIKSLLSRHQLNTASSSGLSSYGVICLAISFLQLNPMVRPATYVEQPMESEALGMLLMDFLDYYGNRFDYHDSVVSVREGKLLSKEEKGWDNPNTPQSLCIECMLNPENDVGRPTSKIGKIRQLFKDAHHLLKQYPFSDSPTAYNVLGTIIGVSDSTLAHRILLHDIVASGRLTRALRDVQISSMNMASVGPHRPQWSQQSSYARYNPRNNPGNDRARGPPPSRQQPPAPIHPSLPPRPPKSPYVAQGPSFGALKAAAATASASASATSVMSSNGKSDSNGNGSGESHLKADSSATTHTNTSSTASSPKGARSPPRRRRKGNNN